jgi:hypothetical protein
MNGSIVEMRPAFSDAAQPPENDSLFVAAAESAKRVCAGKRAKRPRVDRPAIVLVQVRE